MSEAHHHNHVATVTADSERRVFWALLLTGGFLIVEVVGGFLSGSLALLADAGHMLADLVALGLAFVAFRIARRTPDLRRSYGYHRFQVLAAFVNGLALLAIAAGILVAASERLFAPVQVLAGPLLLVAALGLVVNIVALVILRGGDHRNLNLRGAALHVLGDLLGSVAAIGAAVIILLTSWMQADSLLSVVAAFLVVMAGYSIVRQSGHILLEGTPEQLDPLQVRNRLAEHIPEIQDIHHVHIWSLTDERLVLTLHATVREKADYNKVMLAIHRTLETQFGVLHATVQLECGSCTDDLQQAFTDCDASYRSHDNSRGACDTAKLQKPLRRLCEARVWRLD